MTKLCDELNQKRKSLSFCKSTEESKKKKKKKKNYRARKKRKDYNTESESVSCETGGF